MALPIERRPAVPCPVPRCALEWYLALQAVAAGIGVGATGDPRLAVDMVNFGLFLLPMNAALWAVWLTAAGALQMLSLCVLGQAPQRYAAGFGCFTFAMFGVSCFQGGMTSFAAPIAGLAAILELFVCAILRGARWTR